MSEGNDKGAVCVVSGPRGFTVTAPGRKPQTFEYGRGQEAFALAYAIEKAGISPSRKRWRRVSG